MELNRAVALAMAVGPQAALDLVDSLAAEPALRDYHLLPSVRGDLLVKLGRSDEARREFELAASSHATHESAIFCSNALLIQERSRKPNCHDLDHRRP